MATTIEDFIAKSNKNPRIFALHIGRSGDGKSGAAASYPGPYLQLDYDGRFDGIVGMVSQKIIKPEGLSVIHFDPREGYMPTQKILTDLENRKIAGTFPYQTIEIASLGAMCRTLIVDSHKLEKGRTVGNLRISGPSDFNFEVSGSHQIFDFLRGLPCNIVCSAHVIDKWGKPKGANSEFKQNEVVGEKLNVRDQLGEGIQAYFSNVFRFSRDEVNSAMRYYVEFASDIAKNSFGLPPGKFDITGKAFYPFLLECVEKQLSGTLVVAPVSAGLF